MLKGVGKTLEGQRQYPVLIRVIAPQQPQLFLLTNVHQVPRKWAHQQIVMPAIRRRRN